MSPRAVVEEQQEARRLQLIRATYQEVAEKSFADVTLEDIAERAGVSKGVALYYFESKEDLFLAAFEHIILTVADRLKAAVAGASGPVEKIRAALDTSFVGVRENRGFYRAYLDCMSLGARNKNFRELNARFFQRCIAMDLEIVRQGVSEGLFRPDADPAILRAIFDGLMLQWLFDDPATFENYRDRCERALLGYLKVHPVE